MLRQYPHGTKSNHLQQLSDLDRHYYQTHALTIARRQTAALAALAAQRTLSINAMIQDGELRLTAGDQTVLLVPEQRL